MVEVVLNSLFKHQRVHFLLYINIGISISISTSYLFRIQFPTETPSCILPHTYSGLKINSVLPIVPYQFITLHHSFSVLQRDAVKYYFGIFSDEEKSLDKTIRSHYLVQSSNHCIRQIRPIQFPREYLHIEQIKEDIMIPIKHYLRLTSLVGT